MPISSSGPLTADMMMMVVKNTYITPVCCTPLSFFLYVYEYSNQYKPYFFYIRLYCQIGQTLTKSDITKGFW